jgi:DNA replication and repair protein RecF
MDGLFTGPASERRQFLDRIIAALEPGYRSIVNRFEKAMQNRNRLLSDGITDDAQLKGFEIAMAESGIAMAAARRLSLAALQKLIEARRKAGSGLPFPWASLELDGAIDRDLHTSAAIDVEDRYLAILRQARERDRAAGRTLDGPHRTDLVVGHGPKAMPARLSSSGEQKALLLGLVLANAELIRRRRDGKAPILLLDEVTAHLDEVRRAALFAEIERLGAQAWMTGTDQSAFSALDGRACFRRLEEGVAARPLRP